MAVDCLLWRFFSGAQIPLKGIQGYETRQALIICGICNQFISSGEDIQFDHIHADVFDGPHEYRNLRPVHAECHKKKSARDVKDNAKIKRIRGETKQRKGRPMAGTKRSKFKRKLDGTVVLR